MLVDPNKRDRGWAETGDSSTPVVVSFFDDLNENINDCVLQQAYKKFLHRYENARNFVRNVQLRCVFVPSTATSSQNAVRDLVAAHNETMDVISRDPNYAVRNVGRLFAHLMVDDNQAHLFDRASGVTDNEPYFFDKASGVTAQTLEAHAGSDVWVFDFDNTLTCASGLVSTMNAEEEKWAFQQKGDVMYATWANCLRRDLEALLPNKTPANYGVASWDEIDLSPTVVMRVLMGGTWRYDRIFDAYMKAGVDGRLADVYILTSNPMYPLIAYLCGAFFRTDLSMKTFSKHGVEKLFNVEENRIEYQDKGTIIAEYVLPAVARAYTAQHRKTF